MSSSILIGQTIGNYRVESFIARGGFGSVYTARHVVFTDRPPVALKMLHAHLATQEQVDYFMQEARLLEKLKHPHILSIIDAGVQQSLPYLLTEYASLGSLQERIKGAAPQPLPVHDALRIIEEVGQALYYAHLQGVIHRDLKPVNILFNNHNEAVLADFGIATVSDLAHTTSADTIGSPPYMAPEQFAGTVSQKSDQYALACVAYELLTGQRPFDVATDSNWLMWMQKHTGEAPIPPTQRWPHLSARVDAVLLKALSKDRQQRYADIRAFVEDLQAAVMEPYAQHTMRDMVPPPPPHVYGVIQEQPAFVGVPPVIAAGNTSQVELTTSYMGGVGQVQAQMYAAGPEQVRKTDRWLAGLSYLLVGIGGLHILLFKTNQSRFLRFHAWQSFILFLVYILCAGAIVRFTDYPTKDILGLLALLVALTSFIVMIVKSAQGKYTRLPLLGWIAQLLTRKKNKYNEQKPEVTTRFGERFGGFMSYALVFVGAFFLLLFVRKSRYTRFHAWQSLAFFLIMGLLLVVTNGVVLPLIVVAWIVGMYQGAAGRYYRMPFVGRLVGSKPGHKAPDLRE